MSLKDYRILKGLYSARLIKEMNLGSQADTNSGGLGSPTQVIVTGSHNPSDLSVPTPCCKRCGSCSEDEEHYAHPDTGCCKTCNFCPGTASAEDDQEQTGLEFTKNLNVWVPASRRLPVASFNKYDEMDGVAIVKYKYEIVYDKDGISKITPHLTQDIRVKFRCIIYQDGEGGVNNSKENIFGMIIPKDNIKIKYVQSEDGSYGAAEIDLFFLPSFQISEKSSLFFKKPFGRDDI